MYFDVGLSTPAKNKTFTVCLYQTFPLNPSLKNEIDIFRLLLKTLSSISIHENFDCNAKCIANKKHFTFVRTDLQQLVWGGDEHEAREGAMAPRVRNEVLKVEHNPAAKHDKGIRDNTRRYKHTRVKKRPEFCQNPEHVKNTKLRICGYSVPSSKPPKNYVAC